jgi:hypothetical protein
VPPLSAEYANRHQDEHQSYHRRNTYEGQQHALCHAELERERCQKAQRSPSNLLVVLPSSLLPGRNNLTLVTPIILRYQYRSESLNVSGDQARLCPLAALLFSSECVDV